MLLRSLMIAILQRQLIRNESGVCKVVHCTAVAVVHLGDFLMPIGITFRSLPVGFRNCGDVVRQSVE